MALLQSSLKANDERLKPIAIFATPMAIANRTKYVSTQLSESHEHSGVYFCVGDHQIKLLALVGCSHVASQLVRLFHQTPERNAQVHHVGLEKSQPDRDPILSVIMIFHIDGHHTPGNTVIHTGGTNSVQEGSPFSRGSPHFHGKIGILGTHSSWKMRTWGSHFRGSHCHMTPARVHKSMYIASFCVAILPLHIYIHVQAYVKN